MSSFQFLGIPPKGEPGLQCRPVSLHRSFQFLGIPPKGELHMLVNKTQLNDVSNF